jgi:methyl-accepting chemotaxis protein
LGDTSNLILDPDLDSFYLMDVSVVALPSGQERISTLLTTYGTLIKKGANDQEDKLALAIQNALFQQSDLDRIFSSIDTAFNEDNNFYGKSESLQKNISAPLEKFKKSSGNFSKLLSSLKAEQLTKADPKILEAGNEAMEDSFSLWDACSAELQVLLESRILKFQNDRLSSLMLSALALVISFFLVWYIGRGLNNSFIQISGNSKKLIVSSNNQKLVSKSMVANATETSAQANAIASAAEEVSVNIQSVASAAEEIGATIREIAKQSQQAAQVANEAVSIAETGNKAVLRLGENSNIIGNVIKVITSIAEQTNLLALNASIEAARAGEFGKGFAVVASEVKELAKETAKATEDIRTKIEGIQSDTREAVTSNEKTRNIISKIHEIQSTIAGAVEEQAATTREITRNAADAATGSSEIAKNISGLAEAARSTSKGATELETAALGLDTMASELEKIVKTFQIKS